MSLVLPLDPATLEQQIAELDARNPCAKKPALSGPFLLSVAESSRQ